MHGEVRLRGQVFQQLGRVWGVGPRFVTGGVANMPESNGTACPAVAKQGALGKVSADRELFKGFMHILALEASLSMSASTCIDACHR